MRRVVLAINLGCRTDGRVVSVDAVQPILANPGYSVTSLVVGTKVKRLSQSNETID